MDLLSRINIKEHFRPQIYLRGLKYFIQNRVYGLTYDRLNSTWVAQVSGTYDYYVDIKLANIHQGNVQTFCDCPAFDTYGECKHIVAVLLAIQQEVKSKETSINKNSKVIKDFFNNIVASQTHTHVSVMDNLPMNVEYELLLEYDEIYLQIRTGIDHCYVVKNLKEFLQDVLANNHYYFTTKFTFEPELHYFLQQDKEIFQQLLQVAKSSEMFYEQENRYGRSQEKRKVLITPIIMKDLLEKLNERSLTVRSNNDAFTKVEIKTDQSPINFTINRHEKSSDMLTLKTEAGKELIYYEYYDMFFKKGVFYFPNESQLAVLKPAMNLGIRNHLLPIQKDDVDEFFSEVVPALKKTAKVKIDDAVSKEIVQYPLRAKLFLEKNSEEITGMLQYHYGPHEINPFSGNDQSDMIMIRDMEKERIIMNFIEQSNFHYNGQKLYISLDNDDELYDFIYHILPKLDEHVDLYLASDIHRMMLDHEPIASTNVSVRSETNLLEIGFDISGVNEDELSKVIQSIIEKKRFYKLNSGKLMSLENEKFESVQRLFSNLDLNESHVIDGKISLPVYKGTQIDEVIETKKHYDASFRQLLHQLNHPEEQEYLVPEGLEASLRDYQLTGYQWFKSLSYYHLGGILADDMGLGKTIQSIAYILSEPSDHPHLVVVPSSVVYNWRNECKKFAPSLSVAILTGTKEERQKKMQTAKNKDVWITSYGTIRQDMEEYKDLIFQTLLLDEAQYIKNYATKTSKAIRQISAKRRFALSGTPIENSVDELWAIFQVILPGLMPNKKAFRQLEPYKIASMTKPFILRRIKEDVLKELPEKIESVHISELTQEQKELYVGYLQQLQKDTATSIASEGFQKSRMKILAGLTRLRQICCHPSLFIENYEGESGKLNELIDSIEQLTVEGKRMLIFSQFTSMHDIIMKELEDRKIDYFYLHGQTPSEKRVQMTEAFNQGEKSIFLISLRAGGTGLNLTGADTVILFDLWWNPAVEDQAAGRAHRFGQKKVVHVIRYLTEGTIEEKIYELQQKKRELIDQVIQPGETMLSSLSEDDVKELLGM